jgi:hypothetical protein
VVKGFCFFFFDTLLRLGFEIAFASGEVWSFGWLIVVMD